MKLTRKHSKKSLKILTLNKKQYKQLDFTNTGFENKKFQMAVLDKILYVSTTDIKTPNDWRDLGTNLMHKLKALKVTNCYMKLPLKSEEFVEGMGIADYSFNKYKSEPSKEKEIKMHLMAENPKDKGDFVAMLINVGHKVNAQILTKDWVNTTPEDANSATVAVESFRMFDGHPNIETTTIHESDMKELGMNGHLAVNRASRHRAITMKFVYTPNNYSKKTKHHVFVGKGLTYDSGGLSIKPGSSMTNMKSDKAGAMTLLGLMDYISKQGSKHKITCYLALAENMIDGTAYKPDDVLTMMNGKTVHVKNTDAEGRLVLFDNLCLAEEENNDITTIHSLATLTGAAVYQFDGACGLVGFNDKLKKKVIKAGEKTDEIFMNAEFHKNMMNGVDDKLADLSNTGTANMGCQKAGLFLTNALTEKGKKKYLHWDIAGPAFKDGFATGFGVRTLIEFIK